MNGEKSRSTREVADRLRGKKVIRRVDIAHSASEATETVNQELKLEMENPDDFAELRDSIEEAVLDFLSPKSDFSVV